MTSALLARLRSWLSSIRATLTSRAFWSGYSQAFDLFPFPEDYYPHRSDTDAIHSDWKDVGRDMWKAMRPK